MTTSVRLRVEAEHDLGGAARWHEARRNGLGRQFLDEIYRTLRTISEQPAMYPVVARNTHRALVHRFPFGIYYRVKQVAIVVVAILHGSRHPQHWEVRT